MDHDVGDVSLRVWLHLAPKSKTVTVKKMTTKRKKIINYYFN